VSQIGGILAFTDDKDSEALADYAQYIEALGYPALWLPDLLGRDLFTTAAFILDRTERLQVGTAIANVYGRDAFAAARAARTLAELYAGRFVLGLGVSHPQVAEARGHVWEPPVKKLRRYLEEIARSQVRSPEPEIRAPIYIAAHGPKLLALASKQADGANTYLMPVPHTRNAREILGVGPALNVVLPCCLCEDPELARRLARKGLSAYMELPSYHAQWARFGYSAEDLEAGGSDRLIDGLVAWGSEEAIRQRIAEHIAHGATRVIVLPYQTRRRGPGGTGDVVAALAEG